MADKPVVKLNDAAFGELTSMPEAQRLLDRCAERAKEFQLATVPVLTGALSRHIEIDSPTPDSRRIGVLRPKPPLMDATKYVIPVEEGHQTASGSWVPAQPFIRPSIDAAKKGLTNG